MGFEIRENRGRAQGRKKLVREREEYLRLVREGLSNRQACESLGSTQGPVSGGGTAGIDPVVPRGHHRSLRWCPRSVRRVFWLRLIGFISLTGCGR